MFEKNGGEESNPTGMLLSGAVGEFCG